jgi:hypothetical protein
MARLTQSTGILFILSALAGLFIFSGCDRDDETEPQGHHAEEIAIQPEDASFAVGEQVQFNAVLLTAAGDTVDTSGLDVDWQWWSSDDNVFTVEDNGLATGQNPGEAFCIAEVTVLEGSQNFTGRDSVFVVVF